MKIKSQEDKSALSVNKKTFDTLKSYKQMRELKREKSYNARLYKDAGRTRLAYLKWHIFLSVRKAHKDKYIIISKSNCRNTKKRHIAIWYEKSLDRITKMKALKKCVNVNKRSQMRVAISNWTQTLEVIMQTEEKGLKAYEDYYQKVFDVIYKIGCVKPYLLVERSH